MPSVSLRMTSTDSGHDLEIAQQLRRRSAAREPRARGRGLRRTTFMSRGARLPAPGRCVSCGGLGDDLEHVAGLDARAVEDVFIVPGDPAQQPKPARDDADRPSSARAGHAPCAQPVAKRARRRQRVATRQIRRISSTIWRFLPLRRPSQYAATTSRPRRRPRSRSPGPWRPRCARRRRPELAELRLDVVAGDLRSACHDRCAALRAHASSCLFRRAHRPRERRRRRASRTTTITYGTHDQLPVKCEPRLALERAQQADREEARRRCR